MFTLTPRPNLSRRPSIQGRGLDIEVLKAVEEVVTNSLSASRDYLEARKVQPFLQGYSEDSGWIFVEFWGGTQQDQEEYVKYLNSRVKEIVLENLGK